MCEPPTASPEQTDEVVDVIRSISRSTPLVQTVFRPYPLAAVDGAKVFFATTAPAAAMGPMAAWLEREHGCEVVGTSGSLADRPALRGDLEAAPPFELLVVELKAAAVDVAARFATRAGAGVVFCDNRVHPVGGPEGDGTAWRQAIDRLVRLAGERFDARTSRP